MKLFEKFAETYRDWTSEYDGRVDGRRLYPTTEPADTNPVAVITGKRPEPVLVQAENQARLVIRNNTHYRMPPEGNAVSVAIYGALFGAEGGLLDAAKGLLVAGDGAFCWPGTVASKMANAIDAVEPNFQAKWQEMKNRIPVHLRGYQQAWGIGKGANPAGEAFTKVESVWVKEVLDRAGIEIGRSSY